MQLGAEEQVVYKLKTLVGRIISVVQEMVNKGLGIVLSRILVNSIYEGTSFDYNDLVLEADDLGHSVDDLNVIGLHLFFVVEVDYLQLHLVCLVFLTLEDHLPCLCDR